MTLVAWPASHGGCRWLLLIQGASHRLPSPLQAASALGGAAQTVHQGLNRFRMWLSESLSNVVGTVVCAPRKDGAEGPVIRSISASMNKVRAQGQWSKIVVNELVS